MKCHLQTGQIGTQATAGPETVLRRAALLFRTLAHPCRLRLLTALAGGQSCDVNTLVSLCGRPQPYVSQQLGVLRRAGLIIGCAQGQRVCYRLASLQVEKILRIAGLLSSASIRHFPFSPVDHP